MLNTQEVLFLKTDGEKVTSTSLVRDNDFGGICPIAITDWQIARLMAYMASKGWRLSKAGGLNNYRFVKRTD